MIKMQHHSLYAIYISQEKSSNRFTEKGSFIKATLQSFQTLKMK